MKAPRVELGEIAEFINGAAFKPDDWGESGRRIIRIQNLTDDSKPYNCTTRQVPAKLVVFPGDLLVSWSATLGVFEWAGPDEALLNQHIFRVLPDTRRVDKRYLRHGLERALGEMQRHLHGATMQHVNRGEFLATKLLLPSLSEQRRIAEVLDRAEALRAKRRAALAELETLTQSIFLEMFGDPVTNPKGWQRLPLGALASKFSDGPFGSNLKSAHYTEAGIRVVRLQNIGVGEFLDEDSAYISEAHFHELRKHECLPGDVLVGTLGDPNLRACIQPEWLNVAVNKADCVQVRCDDRVATSAFVCALLNQPGTARLAQELMHGQTRTRISMGQLRRLVVPVPALDLQSEFAGRMQATEELKSQQRASLWEFDALFASVQHQAFRGEL